MIVKQPISFDRFQLDIDKTGMSDVELLGFITNLKAIDSTQPEPIVRPLSVSLNAGVLELGFDLTGMTFPVTIDPTLDLQVGASAADSRVSEEVWSATSTVFAVGSNTDGINFFRSQGRFTSVTIAQADTIDVAYATLRVRTTNSATVVRSNLLFENADNPGNVTSLSDFDARVMTAAVAWDNIPAWTAGDDKNTPSIVTPCQTVINRAGWVSGNALNLFWKDSGSDIGGSPSRTAQSYNGSTTFAPKLHIEYTGAAAAGQPYSARVQQVAGMRTYGGF